MRYTVTLTRKSYEYAMLTVEADDAETAEAIAEATVNAPWSRRHTPAVVEWTGGDTDGELAVAISSEIEPACGHPIDALIPGACERPAGHEGPCRAYSLEAGDRR